jgi:hypothetical protein
MCVSYYYHPNLPVRVFSVPALAQMYMYICITCMYVLLWILWTALHNPACVAQSLDYAGVLGYFLLPCLLCIGLFCSLIGLFLGLF